MQTQWLLPGYRLRYMLVEPPALPAMSSERQMLALLAELLGRCTTRKAEFLPTGRGKVLQAQHIHVANRWKVKVHSSTPPRWRIWHAARAPPLAIQPDSCAETA